MSTKILELLSGALTLTILIAVGLSYTKIQDAGPMTLAQVRPTVELVEAEHLSDSLSTVLAQEQISRPELMKARAQAVELEESLNDAQYTVSIRDQEHSERAFYAKLLFSLLFGGAALYIILSQKYDDETKKWAFSVLSLISGVWIGTVA